MVTCDIPLDHVEQTISLARVRRVFCLDAPSGQPNYYLIKRMTNKQFIFAITWQLVGPETLQFGADFDDVTEPLTDEDKRVKRTGRQKANNKTINFATKV